MNTVYQPSEELKMGNNIYKTSIDGLYFIKDNFNKDERGFFREVGLIPELETASNITFTIKQINHSRSVTNVTRGLHAERWNKLITVTAGVAFCALADIRPDSQTFGKVETFQLGFGNQALSGSIFVTEGIANSYCVVEGPVDYVYCVDKLYKERDTSGDQAISLFDPDLDIHWPIERSNMILSKRDTESVTLRDLYPNKFK